MSNLYIVNHFGLGDHIICNGGVRDIINNSQYDNYYLFCYKDNITTVQYMYRDLDMRFITLDRSEVYNGIHFNLEKYINPDDDVIDFGMQTLKHVHVFREYGFHFDECFYNIVKIPYDHKYSSFKCDRDLELEKSLFDKLELKDKEYIFVHDDSSRGMHINDRYLENKIVIRPDYNIASNLFEWCTVIENAKEIHCMDSSFICMIDIMDLGKDIPRYVHYYSKQICLEHWLRLKKRDNWIELN